MTYKLNKDNFLSSDVFILQPDHPACLLPLLQHFAVHLKSSPGGSYIYELFALCSPCSQKQHNHHSLRGKENQVKKNNSSWVCPHKFTLKNNHTVLPQTFSFINDRMAVFPCSKAPWLHLWVKMEDAQFWPLLLALLLQFLQNIKSYNLVHQTACQQKYTLREQISNMEDWTPLLLPMFKYNSNGPKEGNRINKWKNKRNLNVT